MKKILFIVSFIVFILLLTFLSYDVGYKHDEGQNLSSAIYAILVSLFLGAQLWAFVISQVSYSEKIEEVKFEVLENEGIFFE